MSHKAVSMARGYTEEDDYRPSRPARRVESQRGLNNPGYSAHYAESPVITTENQPRTLPRRSAHSRNSTLPRSEAVRSASRSSRLGMRIYRL